MPVLFLLIKIFIAVMHYYTDVLKKYAVFSGRATRSEYWMFTLWNAAIYLVLFLFVSAFHNIVTLVIYYCYALALIVPSLAVLARRLHDTDRSGWWILLMLIPVLGPIVIIVFAAIDSKPGDNIYGPNPKGVSLG
jgi:uncharacterized membrane protein YhaH (DUF805 family)